MYEQVPTYPTGRIAYTDAPLGTQAGLALSKDGIWKSVQGEGPRLGRITTFMRLAGCNLACSWCDTPYTWDWKKFNVRDEVVQMPLTEVARQLYDINTESLTITGGEPLLQWRGLNTLFKEFVTTSLYDVNFETNGTVWPSWDVSVLQGHEFHYVVSPKLGNSGNAVVDSGQKTPGLIATLAKFARAGADFKFVCEQPSDLDEISQLLDVLWQWESAVPLAGHIWIMPQGVEPGLVNRRAQDLAEAVLAREWNMTTRLHIQLWGNIRAR